MIQRLRMMTTEARESRLIAKGRKALRSIQDAVGQFPANVDYLSVEGHKKTANTRLKTIPKPQEGEGTSQQDGEEQDSVKEVGHNKS